MACDDNEANKYDHHGANEKWISRLKRSINGIFKPILKSSATPPQPGDGKWKHLKYNMLLPPSGVVSHTVTIVFIAMIVWAGLWSVLSKDMLPYGNMFGLFILVVIALLAGYLVNLVKLAPLLGMLIAGAVLRNVAPINFTKFVDPSWSSALR